MSDHITRLGATSGARTVGVRELKTHAARIVRHVREARASYVLTHRGQTVGVILPVEAADSGLRAEAADADAAWKAFLLAGQRLSGRFRPGASGVRLLSGMRR
jgi:antitoxin (DNA-binding transcriptional repressor) of toxin-antitoxin stability system